MASSQPRDFARGDARLFRVHTGCQMRRGASVTCAPLRRRQMACFSRACPYSAAALLPAATRAHFCNSRNRPRAVALLARRGNLTQLEPGLCLSGPTWDSGMVGITVTRTHSGRASESWLARRPPPTVSPSGLRGQGRSRRRPRPGARIVIRHDRGGRNLGGLVGRLSSTGSTDALPTHEPGPGPDRARQRRQVESGTAEQRSELLLRQIRRLM